jgi:hypothetical protein
VNTNSAGPPIDTVDGYVFVKAPPIGIMLGQEMIETTIKKSEGVSAKKHHLEQSLLSFTSAANDDGLTIFPFSISVKLESPASFVERTAVSMMEFKMFTDNVDIRPYDEVDSRPRKRLKQSLNDDGNEQEVEDVIYEVEILSGLISATIDADID